MKLTIFLALTSFCMGCVVAEPAETLETPSVPTVPEEHLKTEVPEGWVPILNSQSKNLLIAEYIPPDSPDPWLQKLSIEAMSGDHLPDPLEFTNSWALEQSEICEAFEDLPIYSGFENGYPTIVRMLICGKNKRTGKPLVTMVKVIRGNESLYTITRIWRLEQLPPPEVEIASWSVALRKTIACDPDLSAHPCPE